MILELYVAVDVLPPLMRGKACVCEYVGVSQCMVIELSDIVEFLSHTKYGEELFGTIQDYERRGTENEMLPMTGVRMPNRERG